MINKEITNEYFKFLNNRFLTVGFSGGKDSLATCLYFNENNIRYTPVFIDTGFEHPKTLDYIYNYCKPEILPNLITIRNEKYFNKDSSFKGGFEQMVEHNKIFPSSKLRFCTRLLKITPLVEYLNNIRKETKSKPINANGIRKEESKARSKLSFIDEKDEVTTFRPILNWSKNQVIEIIKKHNIKPNPLYIQGDSRVGCYPCIFSKKNEIRYLATKDIQRINYIEDLEKRVNNLEHNKNINRQAYFFARGNPKKAKPIKDIVKWSLTNAKGEIEDYEEQGCISWGLCEPVQGSLFKDI